MGQILSKIAQLFPSDETLNKELQQSSDLEDKFFALKNFLVARDRNLKNNTVQIANLSHENRVLIKPYDANPKYYQILSSNGYYFLHGDCYNYFREDISQGRVAIGKVLFIEETKNANVGSNEFNLPLGTPYCFVFVERPDN